jgi:hypothetical protein
VKICKTCGLHKPFTEYYIDRKSKDGYCYSCKTCTKEKNNKWRERNKEHLKTYRKNLYALNSEEAKKLVKLWRSENRDRFNSYRREYKKSKREKDPFFKLRQTLSNRTTTAFKLKGWSKNSKTQEMLGADYKTVMNHIESRFKKGMTWDNQGEWHIDHIIPLSSAKTEQELIELCHYTNLQPLWAEENMSKGDKIIACRINL